MAGEFREGAEEQDELNKEWRLSIIREATRSRSERKRAIGTSDGEGRRWAGPDLGYQSQETFNKLETEGYDGDPDYLRNFGWEVRRVQKAAGPVIQSAMEKAAPAIPHIQKAYETAIPWHTRKALEIGGNNLKAVAEPVLEQIERPITAASRALNIHPAVGNTVVEAGIDLATPTVSTTAIKHGSKIFKTVNKALDATKTVPRRLTPMELQRLQFKTNTRKSKFGIDNKRRIAPGLNPKDRGAVGIDKPLNKMDIGSLTGAQTQIEFLRRSALHAIKEVKNHRVFGVLVSDPLTGELGRRLQDLNDKGILTAKNIINAQTLAFNKTSLQHKLGPGFELHHGDFTVNVMAEILSLANPSARARALDLQFMERGKTFGDVYRREGFLSLPKYVHQVAHRNSLASKIDFAGTQYRALYKDLNQLSSAEEISDTISKVNTLIERGTQFAADSKTYQNYLKDFTLALPPSKLKEVMGKNFKLSSNPSRKDVIKWQSIWTNLPPEAKKKLKAMADRQLKLDMVRELENNPEYLHYTKELLSHQ